MSRFENRIYGVGLFVALCTSVIMHASGGVFVSFASGLLDSEDEPSILVVDARVLSEQEFEALRGAETQSPSTEAQPKETAAVERTEPEPPKEKPPQEEALPEEPEPKAAPYASAPAAPDQPSIAEDAQRDSSPDEEIREALPQPAVADASQYLAAPEETDAAPSVSRETDRPNVDDDPCAALLAKREEEGDDRPLSADDPCADFADARDNSEAPDQPEFENEDEQPRQTTQPDLERDGGEEAPAPTPEPQVAEAAPQEPETAAPSSAPRPVRRPRRAAAAPPPEPEPEPEPQPAVDPLAGIDEAVAESAESFEGATSTAADGSPIRGRGGSAPLTIREKSGVRYAFQTCYRVTPGADPKEWTVKLAVDLNADGTLAKRPTVLAPTGELSTAQLAAARAAITAVEQCGPYDMLPPDKYDQWRYLAVTFAPGADAPQVDAGL